MAKHNVYRDGELKAEGIEGNSYTDEDVQSSTEYEYQVSAVNDEGESDLSEPLKVTTEPTVTTEEVTETENVVEYDTHERDNDELPLGERNTVQEGEDGYDTVTYRVTYHDGEEESREEINRETTEPVDEIIDVGTYEEPEEPDPPEDEKETE